MTTCGSGGSATPDQRWAAFKRLNEQATIEVALFSPQDSSSRLPDPSEETLKKFFDEHKQN